MTSVLYQNCQYNEGCSGMSSEQEAGGPMQEQSAILVTSSTLSWATRRYVQPFYPDALA